MNTRILFVDDEPSILEGIRHSFRRQRHQWNMMFVTGGEAALAALDEKPFDVVVSDMRMPGMDGATLLGHVRQRHPGSIRIMLSGHSEEEGIRRALAVAHQFLSKPLEPDRLLEVISKTAGASTMMLDDRLRALIGRIDRLPSAPKIHQQLTEAVADPSTTTAGIVAIVEQDPAMGAKVLQVANSAYFGLPQRMNSLKQAVTYLGLEMLKGLVLTADLFVMHETVGAGGICLGGIQQHSLLMARLMRKFFPEPATADAGFTAALVHDVGKIVLAACLPNVHQQVAERVATDRLPCHLVEAELLGVTHAEIGAYLLGIWGLPPAIVEAVAYHHRPSAAPGGPSGLLSALHVADALVNNVVAGSSSCLPENGLDMPFLEASGYASRVADWKEIAQVEFSGLAP
jgi:HD-like signal output (HDOD) protein